MNEPTKTNQRLTVITICYQSVAAVAATLKSVAEQNDQAFEYAVIDGASVDGTRELLQSHQDMIDISISEPDGGIADAMNKGIARTTGDFILFLNAGDIFSKPSSISNLKTHLEDITEEILAYDILVEHQLERRYQRARPFNSYTLFRMPFCHQAIVYSRQLFDRIGIYDKSYQVAMDYEHLLRAYHAGTNCRQIHDTVTVFKLDGISSDTRWPMLSTRLKEERRANFQHCSSAKLYVIYSLWWYLYWPYKWLRAKLQPRNP